MAVARVWDMFGQKSNSNRLKYGQPELNLIWIYLGKPEPVSVYYIHKLEPSSTNFNNYIIY